MKNKKVLISFAIVFFIWWNPSIALSIQTQKETIQNHINKGIQYGQAGNLESAIKEFEEVLRIDPKNADAFNNLGVAYFRKNNLDKSLYYHTKAIEADPSNSRMYFNRGLLLGKYMSRDEPAIQDYTKAIELNSKFERAYLNRGIAYTFTREYDKAISDFNKIVELNPESLRYILELRARAYYEIGSMNKSLEDINKAENLGIKLSDDFVNKVKEKKGLE